MTPSKTRSSALALICLFLSACVPVTPAGWVGRNGAEAGATGTMPAASSPAVSERDCNLYLPRGEAVGKTLECGYVLVPWDRKHPGGWQPVGALALMGGE